ncbi:MAG: hypothetical protein AB7S26_16410 [Sandaracinaceae bacterium]
MVDRPSNPLASATPSFLGAAHRALLRTFVGREPSLGVLEAALAESERAAEPRIVACVGPGGVGKTTLATVFAERARAEGRAVYWIGLGRGREATLDEAVGVSVASLGRRELSDVVVLDALERDRGALRWALDALAEAGSRVLVLAASREPVELASGPLREVSRELRLKPLTEAETREALARRGVPEAQRAELATLSAGLPRAIAELADRARADRPTPLEERPPHELVDAVVAGIVRDLPSALHRGAVEAAAVACALDEPLLRAMVDPEGGGEAIRELYDWLGARTFIRRGSRGLSAHPRVREALRRDLVARDPVRLGELGRRAAEALVSRVSDAGLATRHTFVLEALFAQRERLGWPSDAAELFEAARGLRLSRLRDAELEAAAASLASSAGIDRAAFERARAAHPDRALVLRGERAPIAFVSLEELGSPSHLGALVAWVGEPDRLEPAHLALHVGLVLHAALELGAETLAMSLPDALDAHAAALGAVRRAGEPYHTVDLAALAPGDGGDARTVAIASALAGIATSPASASPLPNPTPRPTPRPAASPAARGPLLDPSSLGAHVRNALAARHRPHELKKSPLVELAAVRALVLTGVSPERALARVLDEACRALGQAAGYESAARVLELTYLDPTIVKQQAAAAELGLPFGTYRYQLRRALELVTDEIRAREEAAD